MPGPKATCSRPAANPVDAISLVKIDSRDRRRRGREMPVGDLSRAPTTSRSAERRDEVAAEVRRWRVREHLALERAFVRTRGRGLGRRRGPVAARRAGQAAWALELVASIEQGRSNELQRDAAVRVLGDFLSKHAAGE